MQRPCARRTAAGGCGPSGGRPDGKRRVPAPLAMNLVYHIVKKQTKPEKTGFRPILPLWKRCGQAAGPIETGRCRTAPGERAPRLPFLLILQDTEKKGKFFHFFRGYFGKNRQSPLRLVPFCPNARKTARKNRQKYLLYFYAPSGRIKLYFPKKRFSLPAAGPARGPAALPGGGQASRGAELLLQGCRKPIQKKAQ